MQAQGNEGEPVGAKDTQDVRGRSGNGPSEGTALVSAAGLGFVRGLTFPLMISSTFLQEMSLSHGAGNSFGALFFLAYALTMAATAIVHLFHRKPEHRAGMTVAFAAVFAGNALMLARLLGWIGGGWAYAVVVSACIGFGLATAELGWLARITVLAQAGLVSLTRTVPWAYLIGGGAAAFIFWATGPLELGFALIVIVLSAVPLVARKLPENGSGHIGFSNVGAADFVKAVSYLGVFSFVFGAVSQVATTVENEPVPIEVQAVLGIVLAAAIMLAASLRRTPRTLPVSNLYNILFPIVAVALIALPFITSPLLHVTATVLVFVSFYLSGMNVRVTVCQLSVRDNVSTWVYLGIALTVGSVLILAGVALGATVLSEGSPVAGLALVSLLSLFVLALNPIVGERLDRRARRRGAGDRAQGAAREGEAGKSLGGGPAGMGPDPQAMAAAEAAGRKARAALMQVFAEQHDMTAREADVLTLLCQGRTRTYIAAELGISPNTVKGYIHNVYRKANAADKQDLIDRVDLFIERS